MLQLLHLEFQKLKEFEIENGIKIYRLPCYNLMNGRFPTVKFNGEYRKLMRMLKKQKYDFSDYKY